MRDQHLADRANLVVLDVRRNVKVLIAEALDDDPGLLPDVRVAELPVLAQPLHLEDVVRQVDVAQAEQLVHDAFAPAVLVVELCEAHELGEHNDDFAAGVGGACQHHRIAQKLVAVMLRWVVEALAQGLHGHLDDRRAAAVGEPVQVEAKALHASRAQQHAHRSAVQALDAVDQGLMELRLLLQKDRVRVDRRLLGGVDAPHDRHEGSTVDWLVDWLVPERGGRCGGDDGEILRPASSSHGGRNELPDRRLHGVGFSFRQHCQPARCGGEKE